ncbi:MAG: cell division protein FtsW [Sphingobacteriales bacterium]|jgi:cell division protein FtsW
MLNWILSQTKGDRVIWIIVLLLSLVSLLAVYSSTGTLAYKYQSGNTEYYLLKHFGIMVSGLVIMYLTHLVPYKYYSRLSQIMLFIAIPLLFLTLILGTNLNEARRWITLPIINLSFQTSDLAKLALIMFLARMLSKKQDSIKDFMKSFVPIIASVIAVCGLIAPANLSTAAVLFGTSILLMIIGRISFGQISLVLFCGLILLILLVLFGPRRETYKSRIGTFFNKENATAAQLFQSDQAKIAVATGGLIGKGPGNSTQRNYLPHPYSDFIYAIIIEEYGMIGGFGILGLYLIFLYRCIRIVTKSPGAFGALLAAGLSFALVIQALTNMAVNVNLFPVTGLALPLVSMGGTSIWFTSISLGIILSVSKNVEENEDEVPTTGNTVRPANYKVITT